MVVKTLRLTDTGALIERFKGMKLGENSLIEKIFANGVYSIIATFPAVEVVMCKDCKYACEFDGCEDYVEQVRCCTLHNDCDMFPKVWPDDFCSYGERKDNN